MPGSDDDGDGDRRRAYHAAPDAIVTPASPAISNGDAPESEERCSWPVAIEVVELTEVVDELGAASGVVTGSTDVWGAPVGCVDAVLADVVVGGVVTGGAPAERSAATSAGTFATRYG